MQVFPQTEIDLYIKVISFCQVSFFSGFPKGSTGWPCKGEKRKGKQMWNEEKESQEPWPRCRKVLQPFTWQSKRQNERKQCLGRLPQPHLTDFHVYLQFTSNLPKSGLYKMLLYDSAHIQDTQMPSETHKINKTQFSVQVQNVYMPLLQSLNECS